MCTINEINVNVKYYEGHPWDQETMQKLIKQFAKDFKDSYVDLSCPPSYNFFLSFYIYSFIHLILFQALFSFFKIYYIFIYFPFFRSHLL